MNIGVDMGKGDNMTGVSVFNGEKLIESRVIKPMDWKTYRRNYIKRCRKPFLWAVTHGLSIHTYYIDEHFDTKSVTMRTPRQVKAFLKKAWHCPDVRIFDRWFIAYKIRKNKVAPIRNVWMDAFKKYEKILNEDIR